MGCEAGTTPGAGAALWAWCRRNAGGAGICQYLDNQPLADLLAGRWPHAEPLVGEAGLPRVSVRVPGETAHDRDALLESLRRTLPDEGIADLRINGRSSHPETVSEGSFPERTVTTLGQME